MKKLKTIMLSLAMLVMIIPLSNGLGGCLDNSKEEIDVDGNATASSPIVATWLFDTNSYMIVSITVDVKQISIRFSDGIRYKNVSTNGTTGSSLTVNTDNFVASENNTERGKVYSLSGTLNSEGRLVLTGTITLITGYITEQVTLSLTSVVPA